MNVKIIAHTPEPEKVIASAAKLCYSSAADIDTLMGNLTPEKTRAFVEKLESLGHESPFEHVSFTFAIEGVSRVLTHELVRHRLSSYSQRSQRFISEEQFEYYTPPTIASSAFEKDYDEVIKREKNLYEIMVKNGIPKEDARMVLPNATHTRIIVTMNVRTLWNFYRLRCCQRAQLEIRTLAYRMLKLCQETSPTLFKHAGPACMKGYCPEGNMSCGLYPTLEEVLKVYNQHKNL